MVAGLELLLLRIGEELPHLLLGTSDELVKDLWAVDNLGLTGIEDFSDLPRDKGLAAPWGAVQEHPPHVVDAQLLDDVGRPDPRREGPAEDLVEL